MKKLQQKLSQMTVRSMRKQEMFHTTTKRFHVVFVLPGLSAYSYDERICGISSEMSIVFGFDKYWDGFGNGILLGPSENSDLYTTLCNENGALYFWLLIASFILQFIAVILKCKCGSCHFINNIGDNAKITYLFACVLVIISLLLPIIGYLHWKSNSIERIENITRDCMICGYCDRRRLSEKGNITMSFNYTHYGSNYNTSNILHNIRLAYRSYLS